MVPQRRDCYLACICLNTLLLQHQQHVGGGIHAYLTPVVSLARFKLPRSATLSRATTVADSANGECPPTMSNEQGSLNKIINEPNQASKRAMLRFAIPALGIYLANPMLSNIDNAFVGRTVGTAGLAALSPATLCTDQIIYLFSFLGRATTGIVARAYATDYTTTTLPPSINDNTTNSSMDLQQLGGNTEAARKAASAPLTVALLCGTMVSLFYAVATPTMLSVLHVHPSLRPAASSYIYWRGAIAWAALAQSVCLSTMMATRDAVTPLKIVGLAALVNVVGDSLLCAWPVRWGCAGAAAATALATLISCGSMLRALAQKNLLPSISIPSTKELMGLLEFTGPLLAITITRMGGIIAMQRTAMKLGVQSLAGYQLCINLLMFFVLFGEPLSQLSQTKLPALLDRGDGSAVTATLRSILTLAVYTSLGVAAVAYGMAMFGSGFISSDVGVQLVARATAPALFANVAVCIFAIAVDGAMLASRDFGFLLTIGLSTFLMQLKHLSYCKSVSDIFTTFTVRLGVYSVGVLVRILLGFGGVGRSIRSHKRPIASASVPIM